MAEDRYVLLLAGDARGERMSSKSKSRKSGREKLENPPGDLPKVVTVPPKVQDFEKALEPIRITPQPLSC